MNPYASLGVAFTATQHKIMHACSRLARCFHPDAGHEPAAEQCRDDLATARGPLIAPDLRQHQDAELAVPPRSRRLSGLRFETATDFWRVRGEDQHGVLLITRTEACRGVTRRLDLQMPVFDSHGALVFNDHRIELRVPGGVRDGQHLRLKGLGAAGRGGAPAGDLYLEVILLSNAPLGRDAREDSVDQPVAAAAPAAWPCAQTASHPGP